MKITQKIIPFLWFDSQAEEAVSFYVSVFDNSKITRVSRYGDEGFEFHHKPKGSVMSIAFELDGQMFTALNGGPNFTFNEAISFEVICETQEDIDYYWNKLSAGGDESAQKCGWLKDKYGVSWQILPTMLAGMVSDTDYEKSQRVVQAILSMKKISIDELERVYNRAI